MQYTQSSIHFLWVAYIIVAVANIGHAAWLYSLWAKHRAGKS